MTLDTEPVRIADGDDEDVIDLVELFYYYLTKLKIIIGCFLAGALIAGLITYFLITPLYTATSTLYMVSASGDSVVDLTDLNIGTALSEDYAVLMKTRPIAEAVTEELDLDYTYDELMNMVTIAAIDETRVMQISVESPDPDEAKEIANAYADETVDTLPELMETSEPNIAEYAIRPEEKSSPSLTKNTVIGALVAAFACMAVLTVRFLMDDTIKSEEDVEKLFGVMPLTVIPEGDVGGKDPDEGNGSAKKASGKKEKRRRSGR